MAEAVRGGRFVALCRPHGTANCFLSQARIQMEAFLFPGFAIAPAQVLGEYPLPVLSHRGVAPPAAALAAALFLPREAW